jgi:hypothetical protein
VVLIIIRQERGEREERKGERQKREREREEE